jgi:hypothetical protein
MSSSTSLSTALLSLSKNLRLFVQYTIKMMKMTDENLILYQGQFCHNILISAIETHFILTVLIPQKYFKLVLFLQRTPKSIARNQTTKKKSII